MANNLKQLDGFQVLKSVYSPSTNCLRVCVVEGTTGSGSGFEVIITHENDSIRLGNGTNFFTSLSAAGRVALDVAVADSVLPNGASTEAKQDSQITELQSVNSELDAIRARVDQINSDLNSQSDETQTKQDTQTVELQGINSELDAINNKLVDGNDIGDVTINNTPANPVPVSADNLDIRDLDHNQDSVKIYSENPEGQNSVNAVSGKSTVSTTTPLGANAVYESAYKDCSKYNSIAISMLADQASAIDGVEIIFSTDGTDSNIVKRISTTVIPNTPDGSFFVAPCQANFFKVKYTNGPVAQTTFKVEVILKTELIGFATFPINAPLKDTNSAPITRSVLTGKAPEGDYENQRSSGVSDKNSTVTPLGSGASFVGDWEEILGYSNVVVTLKTDADSADSGLVVEWSANGADVIDSDTYTIAGGSGKTFSFGAISRYFRVRYINGPTAQTSFHLQTILHITNPKPSTHRIDDNINGQNDAELVKSVLTGENPNNVFINKRLTGTISSQSTTTPLLANAEFVGPIVSSESYVGVDLTVVSDVVGADNGIKFEWFNDEAGTQLLRSVPFTYDNIIGGSYFHIPVQGQYFRVRYLNDSTDQSFFRLTTRLSDVGKNSTTSPIKEPIVDSLLALLTRAVLIGQKANGEFSNVGLSPSGSISVANTDRPSEVRDRTHININVDRTTLVGGGGTDVYTVTPGKTLYIHSFSFQQLNAANQVGEWRLRDGISNKSSFISPDRATGTAPSSVSTVSPSLPEPMIFTDSVNLLEISGDLQVSGFLIGYEE